MNRTYANLTRGKLVTYQKSKFAKLACAKRFIGSTRLFMLKHKITYKSV